jgi:hypothetical protein
VTHVVDMDMVNLLPAARMGVPVERPCGSPADVWHEACGINGDADNVYDPACTSWHQLCCVLETCRLWPQDVKTLLQPGATDGFIAYGEDSTFVRWKWRGKC